MDITCFFQSFFRRLPSVLLAILITALAFLIFVVAGCIFVCAVSVCIGFLPCLQAGLLITLVLVGIQAAALIINALVLAAAECSAGNQGGGLGAIVVPKGIAGIDTCASAQTALAQARNDLAAAEQAVRSQEERARQARQSLRNAEAAAVGIAAAFIVAILNPFNWGIVAGLVAAAAAAAVLIAQRGARYAREMARLAELALRLASAQVQLAAVEALVSELCNRTPAPGGTVPVQPPTGGILTGTVPVLTVNLLAIDNK